MDREETIYRQDVLDLAKKGVLISNGSYKSVCKAINELPSVNPQPCEECEHKLRGEVEQKTGYWVGADGKPSHLKDGMTTKSVWCSLCGKWLTASDEYSCFGKFCPNCGAKMVEPQESEDSDADSN